MAQGRGPWKLFVFIANMAKLSFNGGSEVFLEYPGLFDVMKYCQLQGEMASQHFITRKRKLVL